MFFGKMGLNVKSFNLDKIVGVTEKVAPTIGTFCGKAR